MVVVVLPAAVVGLTADQDQLLGVIPGIYRNLRRQRAYVSAVVKVRVADDDAIDRLPGIQPVKPIDIWKRSHREQARYVERRVVGLREEVSFMREALAKVEKDRAFASLQQYLGASDFSQATMERQGY